MHLIEQAIDLGFVALGFSRPGEPLFFDRFQAWISTGKQGEMDWMGRHLDLRKNPARLLEGCQTVISLAYPYSHKKPCTPEGFSTARYSEPHKADYHDRLSIQAKIITAEIKRQYPGAKTRACVDSAPILERSFAFSSGIGFIGKNNMLIIPGHGSFLFLAEILTTAFIAHPETEFMDNQCGSCTRCIDACPTGALEAPHSVNASRCLSYLTIEKSGTIDDDTGRKMGNCFFGCDVCQEVCPLNEVDKSNAEVLPSTNTILNMEEETFKEIFGKTAFARAGLNKIKNNIMSIRRNAG